MNDTSIVQTPLSLDLLSSYSSKMLAASRLDTLKDNKEQRAKKSTITMQSFRDQYNESV